MYKQVVDDINKSGERIGAVTVFTLASATCSGIDMFRNNAYFAGIFGLVTLGSSIYRIVETENIKSHVARLPFDQTVTSLCSKMVSESMFAGAYGIAVGLGLALGVSGISEGDRMSGVALLALSTLSTGRYFKHRINSSTANTLLNMVLKHDKRP